MARTPGWIVQAYNATQSAMMGYSPHYLMFGCRPRLPVGFYFPTFGSIEVPMRGTSVKYVDEYVETVHDQLRAALWEAQVQSTAEAQWQKWYYDQKIGTVDLKPGDLDQCRQSFILHQNQLLLIVSVSGIPLCVGVRHAWEQCTSPTPVKKTPKGSDSEIIPWVDSGLASTQCQSSQTPLGLINGKLWFLPWTSTGVSTEDGWRL